MADLDNCPICLDALAEDVFVRACGHGYHFLCMRRFLKRDGAPTCAMCTHDWTQDDETMHDERLDIFEDPASDEEIPIDDHHIALTMRAPEGVLPTCCHEVGFLSDEFTELNNKTMRYICSTASTGIVRAWECLQCQRDISQDDLDRRSDACDCRTGIDSNCQRLPSAGHVSVHIIDLQANDCFRGCALYGSDGRPHIMEECPIVGCNMYVAIRVVGDDIPGTLVVDDDGNSIPDG